jgi:GNAT superfamily N-acetyltransferase
MDAKGILHILTLRDEGRMVGYYLAFVFPHVHYFSSGLMSFTDVYYVQPRYRRGEYGVALLTEAERTLRDRGVTKAYLSCKVHKDLTPLFELLGWHKTDYAFSKMLK